MEKHSAIKALIEKNIDQLYGIKKGFFEEVAFDLRPQRWVRVT